MTWNKNDHLGLSHAEAIEQAKRNPLPLPKYCSMCDEPLDDYRMATDCVIEVVGGERYYYCDHKCLRAAFE